jgi:hypothetical protein
VLSNTILAQQSDNKNNANINNYDCQWLSMYSANKITYLMEDGQNDSIDLVLKNWINYCGISEISQRILILNSIEKKTFKTEYLKTYLDYYFDTIFYHRIHEADDYNFGFRYAKSIVEYGYVPFLH